MRSPGDIWHCLKQCLALTAGGCYWHLVEAGGAAEHSAVHKTAPSVTILPKVSAVPRRRNRWVSHTDMVLWSSECV